MNKFTSIFILLLAMCSIQYGASVAKKLFPLAGPASATSLRLMFASLILVLIFRPWKVKFEKEVWRKLAIYGVSLGLMNLSFYFALERIPLGIAVALEFTGPLAVAIFASRRKIDFVWAMMAALGLYMLLPLNTESHLDSLGVFFALLAGFFWALYIIFGKKAGNSLSGVMASSIGMSFAALITLPAGIVLGPPTAFTGDALVLGLIIGIFGSAIPYSLEMISLKNLSTKTFGILMSLEPVVASVIGLFFLGETLSLAQWVAILSIMISSLGSALTSENTSKA